MRAFVLDQITPDMSPWVFATVAPFEVRSTPSAKKEGFIEVDVYMVVLADPTRYPDQGPDTLLLLLITDVMKAIESSPSLADVDGWLEAIRLEEKDLDPENDLWGFARLRVRYAINGTLGQ